MMHIPNHYWAYLALAFWGALCILLLGRIPYGIDEGAARALLLVWSVVDNVVSPVAASGLADFRTIFLVPAGILWTGNILAAKITTIIVMAGAVLYIYNWRQRSGNAESALLASGLLLLSPLIIDQIDSISVAPYLLITFALGAWADKIFREKPLAFGGMYFSQMFLCLVSTTLHPAGLAYPLVLLWTWYRTPVGSQRIYFFGGIIFSVLFALLLTQGWHHVEWLTNPILSLSSLISGSSTDHEMGTFRWASGIGVALVLLLVIWKQAGSIWADLLGRTLLASLAVGILVGDESWALIALAILFYWGFSMLLNTSASSGGVMRQRWIVLTLIFITATSFMLVDKARYQQALTGDLAPSDNLIRTLVEYTSSQPDEESETLDQPAKKPLIIASQWPGRTMLACRCGAYPLPPPAKDELALLEMLRGINFVIFDPKDPKNRSLSQNLALMNAGNAETLALQEGGVIVEIKEAAPAKPAK